MMLSRTTGAATTKRRSRRRCSPPLSFFATTRTFLLLQAMMTGIRNDGGRYGSSYAHAASIISQGVPGSIHTKSGYDTEMGVDPICWVTENGQFKNAATAVLLEDNKLVSNFYLPNSPVGLLPSCPSGVRISGTVAASVGAEDDHEFVGSNGEGRRRPLLRTGDVIPYHVRATIDATELRGDAFTSNKLPFAAMQVQIVLCLTDEVGFCSPYVHEHANARLERMNMTTEVRTGDRHGNTHVHAYGDFVPIEQVDLVNGDAGGGAGVRAVQEIDVVVPVLVNDPGDFFAIAAIQLFTANATDPDTPLYKYDIANALDTRLISYREKPTILTVTRGVNVATWTFIVLAASIELALLAYGVWHRGSNVMQLCQGRFLLAFLLAATFATSSSFLFNPKNDSYCNLRGPLIFIPVQLMYAITIGRLWRINAVISPILKSSIRKVDRGSGRLSGRFCVFLTAVSNVSLTCNAARVKEWKRTCRRRRMRRRSTTVNRFRVTVTSKQLAKVVAFFTAPMVVLQILGTVLETKTLGVVYNDDESVGRVYCRSPDGGFGGAFDIASMVLFLLLFFVLLSMAYESRDLPSLLNETDRIYNAALTTMFVVALGLFVIIITSTGMTSPDVQYVLSVAMLIAVTLTMSCEIMLPKYKIINDGDHVMVSKLVSDHREYSSSGEESRSDSRINESISVAVDSTGSTSRESETSSNVPKIAVPTEGAACMMPTKTIDENGKLSYVSAQVVSEGQNLGSQRRMDRRFSSDFGRSLDTRMVITEADTPPRRLLLRLVDANENLEQMTKRIMSGMTINREEWEELREVLIDVGHTFKDQVRFEWDEESSAEHVEMANVSCGLSNQRGQMDHSGITPQQRGPVAYSNQQERGSASSIIQQERIRAFSNSQRGGRALAFLGLNNPAA